MIITLGEIASLIPDTTISTEWESAVVRRLLTDSRSFLTPEGTLFFAIPTATNSGERYMRRLYDRGVRMFVAPAVPEDMRDVKDAAILICDNPVALLQKIASRGDSMQGGEVIAITGSYGKTTLKEILFQLLEPLHEIVRSPRSYNSQIGVPLSLWGITENTDLTIIEAGISRSGEMANLEKCIRPDSVILTDMGDEHDDGFADHNAKLAEKVSLARRAKRIFFCADDIRVTQQIDNLPDTVKRISWSLTSDDCDLRISDIKKCGHTDNRIADKVLISYKWRDLEMHQIEVEAANTNDIRAFCSALCYMLEAGYSPTLISRRFRDIHPVDTRMSVIDGANNCNIVYDAYPADVSTLLPALDFLVRRRMPDQTTTVILADLRHEAEEAEVAYGMVADYLRLRNIDNFIGVGSHIGDYAHCFDNNALFFKDTSALLSYLREHPVSDSVILLKGSRESDLHNVLERLVKRTHETVLEVNLDAMVENYRYFKSHLPASTGIVAMVKASAYGAGSYEIAKTMQDAGATYLAVAVLDEGIELRRQGITMPIMVMNPRVADYRDMFAYHLEPEIYSPAMLEDVIAAARKYGVDNYPIHIKLDTGMHRMGFIESELRTLMERINSQDSVRIASVFSHLATADMPDMNDYTDFQLKNFENWSSFMRDMYPGSFKRHILNSAGILRYGKTHHYDMARLGIGLYGVNTLPSDMEKPLSVVSTLKSVIINLREWEADTTIGYARRGVLDRKSTIATIPIGYADGMSRKFGNGAIKVRVNGKDAPTIGNICMDACMIDVTGIDCKVGDEVEIFGQNIPLYRLADVLETIPYEILTSVSPRVKRIYYRE